MRVPMPTDLSESSLLVASHDAAVLGAFEDVVDLAALNLAPRQTEVG